MKYNLQWKSLPMDALVGHENWYDPFLGQGVYMLVLATTKGEYVGYYVGKSEDIGRRWREHVQTWFTDPHDGYYIPKDANEFLKDPVCVFNSRGLCQNLSNRASIQERILKETWFCFAEVNELSSGHTLETVEYVLQMALKKHVGIKVDGYIGDTGRGVPPGDLEIENTFGRPFLENTLRKTVRYSIEQVRFE